VSGCCAREIGYFAFNPDILELYIGIDQRLDIAGDAANRSHFHAPIIAQNMGCERRVWREDSVSPCVGEWSCGVGEYKICTKQHETVGANLMFALYVSLLRLPTQDRTESA